MVEPPFFFFFFLPWVAISMIFFFLYFFCCGKQKAHICGLEIYGRDITHMLGCSISVGIGRIPFSIRHRAARSRKRDPVG